MNGKEYWDTEGIRMLNPDNSIPSVEDRVIAAFNAGRRCGLSEFDLPDDAWIAAVETEEVE